MLHSITFRYAATVGGLMLFFANFIACGSNFYQVSMENDFDEQNLPAEAKDPASTTYGIHAVGGWKNLPIPFRYGHELNRMQKDALTVAMQSWEMAVGKKLFKNIGTDKQNSGDKFPDLYSSLSDMINGHYLDGNWGKTGKPVSVLATTIWHNTAEDVSAIATADIRFNSENYLIGDSLILNSVGGKEIVDMESLALHELGHLLGLAHVDASVDPLSIMNPQLFIGAGLTSRKISKSDIQRIQTIYGCHGNSCEVEDLVRKIEISKSSTSPSEIMGTSSEEAH
jgi:hypothetical protein